MRGQVRDGEDKMRLRCPENKVRGGFAGHAARSSGHDATSEERVEAHSSHQHNKARL
jgi:hypothetical protein